MFKALAATGVACAILSGPAFCADLYGRPAYAPAAPPMISSSPAYSWAGLYAGAQVGGGWGKASQPYGYYQTGSYPFTQADADQKGAFGGIYGGYNYQFNSLVLGVDADLNFDGIKGNDGGGGGDINGVDHKWNASVRGRIGFTPFDRALVYGAAGVAFLGADATNEDASPTEKHGKTWTGYTVGAGLEYAFTNNLVGRTEYRYTDYGKATADFPTSYSERINPKINSVSVGLAYKF